MNLNSWPSFNNEQQEVVKNILNSGNVNYLYGSEGKNFENEFSNYFGLKYSICFSNGTTALYSAYKALNLGKDDEFITTPRTFIATISAAVLLGAKPIFADIDLNSGCITAESVEPLITKKTKVICVVHLGGWPAEMDKIRDLAKAYNIYLIEDCSQAHGAKFKGFNVGTFGDISVWSFCTDKIISTGGEGGMVSTNSEKLFNFMWSFKDHGKSLKKFKKVNNSSKFQFLHDEFGLNFRMTEIQSALGRYQLKCLNEYVQLRNKNASILKNYLREVNCIRIPTYDENVYHAHYKFYAYLIKDFLLSDWDKSKIINEIRNSGFPCFEGSCSEVYLEKCFKKDGLMPKKRLPNAKNLGEDSLMFLVHPTITESQMHVYGETVRSILIKAMK